MCVPPTKSAKQGLATICWRFALNKEGLNIFFAYYGCVERGRLASWRPSDMTAAFVVGFCFLGMGGDGMGGGASYDAFLFLPGA